MSKSWLKGLWLLSLSGILAAALTTAKPSRTSHDAVTLSEQGYSRSIRQTFAQLTFLSELRQIAPTTSKAEVFALIRRYEGPLSQSETFYLESCLATIPLDASLGECERLLYRGLDQLTDRWRIPIVMGMISAMTYRELDKAATFFNLALSKPHLPADLAGFPRVASDEQERLAVRVSSLLRLAAQDQTIANYRRTLKNAIANRESSSNAAADPGSQEHREAL